MNDALRFNHLSTVHVGDVTIVTASDVHGRTWSAVSQAGGFDTIIDPSGEVFGSWREPHEQLSPRTVAFIDFVLAL